MTPQERAEKMVRLVCKILYDDSPTSFDGLDFSPIAAEIEAALSETHFFNHDEYIKAAKQYAYEEAAKIADRELEEGDYTNTPKKIRARAREV